MTSAVRIQREVRATDRGSQRGLDLVAGTERVFVRRQLDRIRHAEPALQLVDRHAWRVCLPAQHAGGGILEGLVCHGLETRNYITVSGQEPRLLKNAADERIVSSPARHLGSEACTATSPTKH